MSAGAEAALIASPRNSLAHGRVESCTRATAETPGPVRGDPDLAESLLGQPDSNRLFEEQVDGPHYVVRNRLGRTVVLPAERPNWVGQIEFFLYTHPYDPSDAIKEATNLDELRQALADEVDRIDRLREDGWDMYKNDGVGVQLLVDTRRPDEKLTKRDLP